MTLLIRNPVPNIQANPYIFIKIFFNMFIKPCSLYRLLVKPVISGFILGDIGSTQWPNPDSGFHINIMYAN